MAHSFLLRGAYSPQAHSLYAGARFVSLRPCKAGSQEKCRWRHPQLSLGMLGESNVIESGFLSKLGLLGQSPVAGPVPAIHVFLV
jgi:hypothetical protein